MTLHRTAFLLSALLLGACQAPGAAPSVASAVTVEVGGAIEHHDTPIALVPETASQRRVASALPQAVRFVARTVPVVVDGLAVQANALLLRGHRAVLAYNTAGDAYGGAIQVLDLSDPARPRVAHVLKFSHLDVNCLALDGDRLLFGGAADPDHHAFRAFVGTVDLARPDAGAVAAGLRGLRSFAANGIARHGSQTYVSVGAQDGGLVALDDQLGERAFWPLPDVRDVVPYRDGVLALAGDTDAAGSSSALVAWDARAAGEPQPLASFGSAYAKASLAVLPEDRVLLALSAGGVAIRDLRAPYTTRFTLPNPSADAAHAANSAAWDGQWIFVANGEYGFRVLQRHDGPPYASLAGYHRLAGEAYGGQAYSANQIAYRGRVLAVATGVGGVNLYTLENEAAEPSPPPAASPAAAASGAVELAGQPGE